MPAVGDRSHTQRRPASANLQCTKSREAEHPAAAGWKNGPNRFRELRRRGVQKFLAAVAAGSPTGFWRMSGHPALQKALRNHVFDSLGLPRLYIAR